MWSKSSWNIIASQAPKTIKGPKGSSDFKVIRAPDFIVIFSRLKSMRVIPYAAPNQKERTRLDKARGRPKRNPIERPNLASPKPMARPPEKSHTDAKNIKAKYWNKQHRHCHKYQARPNFDQRILPRDFDLAVFTPATQG